jgi:hypothetical protein
MFKVFGHKNGGFEINREIGWGPRYTFMSLHWKTYGFELEAKSSKACVTPVEGPKIWVLMAMVELGGKMKNEWLLFVALQNGQQQTKAPLMDCLDGCSWPMG